ncbi:unnamed protein product [Cylicocyclus nassatus]|uniref:WW domain-binding protein 4 n=1 Tax=Cylicocyclus nassatus TaxID=53992 RepID=A0AA36H4E2_CYLNA|nr:unnamed protein product [Cylicocyclus nassatus]
MADVWISQGRKFCEICKVWFGDNRASIEFHERGKKHKDALANKIRELGKKQREETKARYSLNSALAQMEAAALVSMAERGEGISHGPALPARGLASKIFDPRQFKDVTTFARQMAMRKNEHRELKRSAPPPMSSAPMSAKYFRGDSSVKVEYPFLSIPETKVEVTAHTPTSMDVAAAHAPASASQTYWVEADSPDGSGRKYYFHMYTGESTWEKPESFFTWEVYQSYISAYQTPAAGTTTSSEEMHASSAAVETVPETKPEVKSEAPAAEGSREIGDIPLPQVDDADAEASVDVKQEPVEQASEGEPQSDSEVQKSTTAAPTPWEVVKDPYPAKPVPTTQEVSTGGDSVDKLIKATPYGGWTRVEKTDKEMFLSPLTEKYRAEEERQRKETEAREKLEEKLEPVEFTEKTSANLTKKVKGPIEFKKRTATKNVRQRTTE